MENKNFFRNLFLLVGSSGAGQLVLFCIIPILTRLYTPQDFGSFGLFLAYVTIATVFACLRFEIAIVVAKNEEESIALFFISLAGVIFFSIVFTAIYLILIKFNLIGFGDLWIWSAVIIFLIIIANNIYQIGCSYFLREKKYKVIASTMLYQNFGKVIFSLLFGLFNIKTGLMFADFCGRFCGMLQAIQKFIFFYKKSFINFNLKTCILVFKKYKNFPLLALPSAVIDNILFAIPVPIISYFFGLEYAGFYTLAYRGIGLPLNLLSKNIGDIFYSDIANINRSAPEKIKKEFLHMSLKLLLFAVVLLSIIMAIASKFLVFILGIKWQTTAMLVMYLAPWMMMQFIISALNRIVLVINKQKFKLYIDFFIIILLATAFYLGKYLALDFFNVILLVTAINVVLYVIYYLWLFYFVANYSDNNLAFANGTVAVEYNTTR